MDQAAKHNTIIQIKTACVGVSESIALMITTNSRPINAVQYFPHTPM